MWHPPEGHERTSVARWQVADLLWQERESHGPFPVWHVCVCHQDAPVHHDNMTSVRPSSPPTRLPASDHEDKFTKLMCCSFGESTFRHMYASTFVRPCIVWLDSKTCSRARRGESTLGETCSRHNDTSSVSKGGSLTISMFVASSSEDASQLETTSPSCRKDRFRHPAITWVSVCFKGQLWRDVWSPYRCFPFAVLPTNSSLKHPHTWEPCPRTRHRSCFEEVSNSMLSCLVLVTRCDGSIDISAVHCPRRQVFTVHLLMGCSGGCVNARCLFILALSTFC